MEIHLVTRIQDPAVLQYVIYAHAGAYYAVREDHLKGTAIWLQNTIFGTYQEAQEAINRDQKAQE